MSRRKWWIKQKRNLINSFIDDNDCFSYHTCSERLITTWKHKSNLFHSWIQPRVFRNGLSRPRVWTSLDTIIRPWKSREHGQKHYFRDIHRAEPNGICGSSERTMREMWRQNVAASRKGMATNSSQTMNAAGTMAGFDGIKSTPENNENLERPRFWFVLTRFWI